jgi:hypothetical protein
VYPFGYSIFFGRLLKTGIFMVVLVGLTALSAIAPALLNHKDVAKAENAWSGFLPTSCIYAMDGVNAEIAGANLCPCSCR